MSATALNIFSALIWPIRAYHSYLTPTCIEESLASDGLQVFLDITEPATEDGLTDTCDFKRDLCNLLGLI